MRKKFVKMLLPLIQPIVRRARPRNKYFLFGSRIIHKSQPLSSRYGFDRGKPIDRYYIEKFLEKNKGCIKGRCLEVTDNDYTKRFGARRVKWSDVLDINKDNGEANVYGDLRNLKGVIEDATYDCIILTHVLGEIDDYEAVLSECHRILRPGGVILFTGSVFNFINTSENNFWRFTPASTKYVFGKFFDHERVKVYSYGNVLAGQAFWVGMAQEDLKKSELSHNDKRYPIIVACRAIKS